MAMCLMMKGDTVFLIVSDRCNKYLGWISLGDDLYMKYHHTQRLDYQPSGLYDDRGELMVCEIIYSPANTIR